eukprot:c19421_g1_i1 orf=280-1788(-)
MKSSIKFREEKSPLLRAKLPFKLGPIPFSSGIAVGNKQDLAMHVGVGFSACPIIKLAFKPHDPNPLSVVLKAGLGSWGSPNDAPLTLTAEFCLTPNGGNRLLSLRLKPRVGDFSIRKDVRNVSFLPGQQKEVATTTSVRLQLLETGNQNQVITPLKGENGAKVSAFSNEDVIAAPKHINVNCFEEQLCSPCVDSSTASVIGSSISLKLEEMEKGRNDCKPKLEGHKEQDVQADLSTHSNPMIVHVPCKMLHEHKKVDSCQSAASFSLAGAQDALRGCKVVSHSSLPLGNQARLNVRWALKSAPAFFQGWDGSLPSLPFSKLPSLLLDKVSFEQVTSCIEKPAMDARGPETVGSFEQGLLPVSFVEENRELAQVAAMCYTMKRQLHLMHAENQVLRRAMEEMKSHVESKGSLIPDGMLTSGQSISRPPPKSSLLDMPLPPQQQRREGGHRDVQVGKGQKVMPRKDEDLHLKSISSGGNSVDVSKELEKAILSAQIGSAMGKKE